MKSRLRFLMILASALLAVGVLTAAVAWRVASPLPKVTTSGTAAIGGPFTLVATNGEDVSDQMYRGKWLLIFFGYTFCPDACPTALNNISVALEKLGSDAANLQPLFVTVDPHRDTRELMRDVEVAPGARASFSPGGVHIMVVGLKQPLKVGQSFPLTLTFEKAGKEAVSVPIAKVGAMQHGDTGSMTHEHGNATKK